MVNAERDNTPGRYVLQWPVDGASSMMVMIDGGRFPIIFVWWGALVAAAATAGGLLFN